MNPARGNSRKYLQANEKYMYTQVKPEQDYKFKLLMIGDAWVGKTCLLLRFADDSFQDNYLSTIGVNFKIRTVELDGKVTKFSIWDTAGQERFRALNSNYYRGTHGVIVIFDVTSYTSFLNIKDWLKEVDKYVDQSVPIILVGNKCDLLSQRVVEYQAAKRLADELGLKYYETSAKRGTNVDEAFNAINREIRSRVDKGKMNNGGGTYLCAKVEFTSENKRGRKQRRRQTCC
eukprot:TRINITY_DN579_c0_g1_i6.p1 TRINITY_DN579_c0_g1~~TRINITY_DN579_c0_g1_i6.p1  ORF type:complete len:265 (+),score=15.23 TRINITY_DN579_c0_g1_i6:101-796(+)